MAGEVVVNNESSDQASTTANAASSAPASSTTETTTATTTGVEDIYTKILNQVEFYFSDSNLPSDKFMLNYTGKAGTNPVPIKIICSFKRMKAICSDVELVTTVLRKSDKLIVHGEGESALVGRAQPLASVDYKKLKVRTVVAENITISPLTIDSIKQHFSQCGQVLLVRICTPPNPQAIVNGSAVVNPDAAVPTTTTPTTTPSVAPPISQQHPFLKEHSIANITGTYALVEFATEDEAALAETTLTELNSWRGGMRVKCLGKSAKKKKTPPQPATTAAAATTATTTTSNKDDEETKTRFAKYNGFKRKSSSSSSPAATTSPSPAAAAAANSASPSAPGSTLLPKGPDGTKGFAVGRGKPVAAA